MRATRRVRFHLLAATLLCLAGRAAGAEDYWSYADGDTQVTTYEGAGYTASLVRDLARFNEVLIRILQLPERHMPIRIYELSPEQARQLLGGSAGGASYKFSGYDVSVVTSEGQDQQNRYWGALFGYTGALFLNGWTSRSPYWFQVGVPALFAQTEFESSKVRTGGLVPGFVWTLQNGKRIPIRTFLRMQRTDPQLQSSSAFKSIFEAQSWYLAHEIYVEGKLRPEFFQYLALIRDGKTESDAFAASFKISYEDLDKVLSEALKEQPHVFVVNEPPAGITGQAPRKLTISETKAMLADLSLQWGHRPDALRLAAEALQGDTNNELALRVQARGKLRDGDFSGAFANADKLVGLSAVSAAALTDSGDVFVKLADEVESKQVAIGVTADELNQRARDAYHRAIGLDPEYLRAWAGLAYLYGSQRDAAAAKELAEKAEPVMEAHLNSGALARALATMCGRTGQTHAAFLFGEYWRDDALTPADRDAAMAFIAQLRAQ
jgi:tetratricopeptide (TPR) repeat protein